MIKDPSNPRDSGRLIRVLWLLGLIAGIAVGTVAAFGLATVETPSPTEATP